MNDIQWETLKALVEASVEVARLHPEATPEEIADCMEDTVGVRQDLGAVFGESASSYMISLN